MQILCYIWCFLQYNVLGQQQKFKLLFYCFTKIPVVLQVLHLSQNLPIKQYGRGKENYTDRCYKSQDRKIVRKDVRSKKKNKWSATSTTSMVARLISGEFSSWGFGRRLTLWLSFQTWWNSFQAKQAIARIRSWWSLSNLQYSSAWVHVSCLVPSSSPSGKGVRKSNQDTGLLNFFNIL